MSPKQNAADERSALSADLSTKLIDVPEDVYLETDA